MDKSSSNSSRSKSGENASVYSYSKYQTNLNLNNLGNEDFEEKFNTDIDPSEFFSSEKMSQYKKKQEEGQKVI